jgi:type I restriction enzyme S subunit
VIGRKGALGTTFYLDCDYWPHDTTLWVKDFKGSLPRFVYYFFLNLDVKGLDVGSANPTLNRNHVHPLPVRWPERRGQERIAAVLAAFDDKIAVNDRIAETAEALTMALGSDERWATIVPLAEIVDHVKDQVQPGILAADRVAHYSIPAFDSMRLPEVVNPRSIKSSKFKVDTAAVLVSKLNPSIPRIWNIDPSPQMPSLASTEFLVLRPRLGISTDELWTACRQPTFTASLVGKVTGTSNSHQRVKPGDLLATEVIDPRAMPGKVRSSISAIARRSHQARVESLSLGQLRDTLLPKLISGQIRVREAERIAEGAT